MLSFFSAGHRSCKQPQSARWSAAVLGILGAILGGWMQAWPGIVMNKSGRRQKSMHNGSKPPWNGLLMGARIVCRRADLHGADLHGVNLGKSTGQQHRRT